jgi:hypothetical protein
MHPLCNNFGSIAAIAAALRQSPEAAVIQLTPRDGAQTRHTSRPTTRNSVRGFGTTRLGSFDISASLSPANANAAHHTLLEELGANYELSPYVLDCESRSPSEAPSGRVRT